ncbi:putative bifunctional diguanylate cyclase/phosphodiesterase [Novosphingobium album (ex Hu et al. 2023)]|uniref:EAL domain-containing protein n=1 Tax=Novosphingobium album (ex Hu et al. 2023) TaxID=2930093 RepID=A0ABT0B2T4_9SPHN|nr:GGDEF domain-containing protein [Novosphingobium album (ex Hu et al. 2023)]MCJ2179220.1 EAL domain-containing protein [Novosphingobium album (ex Hu et al. 2023)]
MLKFKATILELIAKGLPLAEVMHGICLQIEERFQGVVCSVLILDRSGTLHPLAAPSLPEDYSQSLDNLTIGPNVGSCGTAAYLGQPVEVHDIARDPRWSPFPAFQEAALSLGLRACWSSPLVDEKNTVLATFALYFRVPRAPTGEERAIVDVCLHLCHLAFARHLRVADRERRANTDALTDLPNQGSFSRAIAHLGCEEPGAWGVLMIDLDNLKTVNDTFSHSAGDQLLQELAARLSRFVFPDSAFRVGGDEFAVLIKDPVRLQDMQKTATSLLEILSRPVECEKFSLVAEASIGGAIVAGDEAVPEDVRYKADLALHHAKESGRGGYVQFAKGVGKRMIARISSIESLDAALKEGRIEAWYQPVVRLADRRIVGFEALSRMVSPDGEIISASAFAEAAGDVRVASVLTHRMLSAVAEDMRAWSALGIDFGYVAVNVTAVDLRGGRLGETLDRLFPDERLMKRLILEVTERVYIGERDRLVCEALAHLRRRGVYIALDDFGTGFASLTHLLELSVDFIKVDQAFTARLPDDDVSGTIIAGLVAIAGKLGASVTAEGVETDAQAEKLLELGCQVGQGFLFSRGVPAGEAARLLMRHGASNPHGVPLPGGRIPAPREEAVLPTEAPRRRYTRTRAAGETG